MIRVRLASGELVNLPPDAAFVELCSEDGKVAAVLAVPRDGSVVHITPGSEEAGRYKTAYGVSWCSTRQLRD